MENSQTLRTQLQKAQTIALVVGVVGIAATAFGAFSAKTQFFQSYLFGYLFWIGLTLGSLAILSLQHLVSSGWGFVIQRILESATRTIPVMAVLFIPILFGMKVLFFWARPEVVATDAILQHKSAYLNVTFFGIRAAAFFGIWFLLIFFMNIWSGAQDEKAETSLSKRMVKLSGPALVIYVLTMTFAAFDWAMSLDPHWFSTIFGFVFVIGQGVLTLAFATVVVSKLARHKPLSDVIGKQQYHDLGNLLLAFIALWAYINVSQFLIIWSGNLPEEIPWYLHRLTGAWGALAVFVVAFHFAVPFALLLSRRNKRNVNVLYKIAVAIMIVRLFDLFWIISPNFHEHGIHVHWLDFAAPVGIGGVWMAVFVWQLQARPLLPVNDPRLKEAFHHE